MRKNLPFHDIDDLPTRTVVESIVEEMDDQVLSKFRGRFLTMTLGAGTHTWPHGLGFIPRDCLVTSTRGGSFTWNYADFTKTHVSLTVTGAETTIRAFVGRYLEE